MTTSYPYIVTEQLYQGKAFTVYRAVEAQSGAHVVMKRLAPGRATPLRIEQIRLEFDILRGLSVPAVVKARELLEHGDGYDLVLEDFVGETLGSRYAKELPSLPRFLGMAIDLADALGHVHAQHVIHKDINPNNILVDGQGRIQVIDFNLSTRLSREVQGLKNANLLEGTLWFISPEQTGRMNRAIDYRTDLYSLGATFYLLLTGRVPFPLQDPLELVHAHIAKRPEPPNEVNPRVPEAVSAIVMKLLQKAAEDRYQSAFGLRADLEQCAAELAASGSIRPFPLETRAVSARFQIPERLYGRQAEVAALEEAFERVSRGVPELLLIGGAAGVGKSAVVQELYKALARRPGFLLSGKFDQLRRNIAYSAVLDALGELCRYLLAESEERLAVVRRRLLESLGSVGQVLVDVLPDLALIMGAQPPVIPLPPTAAQHRFRYAFQRLLHALCPAGQPLVLFLDDLQWADSASLDLLASALSDEGERSLLVIGSFRDDEVAAGHPLLGTIAAIEAARVHVSRLSLGPLGEPEVIALLSDTLGRPPEELCTLGRLVMRKTHGNAFFTGQFLLTLYKSELISFDAARLCWSWDEARIEAAKVADNVAGLMEARARALSEEAQAVLKLASCVGNRFDRETLAMVTERSALEVHAALGAAAEEGLVVSLGEGMYRFVHDRVQQAAYALFGEEERLRAHLRVGRLLAWRLRAGGEKVDDNLFDVVHHLNLASARVDEAGERLELARLNLTAGQRARAAAAFGPSAAYFEAGLALLSDDERKAHRALTYALHLGIAESASMLGHHEVAERFFPILMRDASHDLEAAQVRQMQLCLYSRIGKAREAADAGLDGLARLGVELDRSPGVAGVLAEIARARRAVGWRSDEDFLNMPELTDPRLLLALELLRYVASAAIYFDRNLLATTSMRMVTLAAHHGSSQTSMSFMTYAGVLGIVFKNRDARNRFGKLGLAFLERYPSKMLEPHVVTSYVGLIHNWQSPIRAAFPSIERAARSGMEVGEFQHVGSLRAMQISLRFILGTNLDRLLAEAESALAFVKKGRFASDTSLAQSHRQAIVALLGKTKSTNSLSTDDCEEQDILASFRGLPIEGIAAGVYWTYKSYVLFVLGHHEEALDVCREHHRATMRDLASITETTVAVFTYALALASAYEAQGAAGRARDLVTLGLLVRQMRAWADRAPMNFRQKSLLMEAELARVTGRDRTAISLYEDAIRTARQNQFVNDEAIALELTGRFYLARGAADAAWPYLSRARKAYLRWGAHGKISRLDEAYPNLERAAEPAAVLSDVSTSSTTSAALDAPTMIKASQALSGEVSLERLLTRLMQVVVESAGAERGALLLRAPDGALELTAALTSEGGAAVLAKPRPIGSESPLPLTMVQYAARTQRSLVVPDAASDGAYGKDPYIKARAVKSALCMPLVQQGDFKGVLYLENNLAAGAFTDDRVELLRVLCGQMTISIENARLYAGLEQKVTERTEALRAAQARLLKLEKDATEVQMAGGFAHEMRNALSSAKLALTVWQGGDRATLCSENSEALKGIFLRLRPLLPADAVAELARTMKKINGNERTLDEILGRVDGSLTRALEVTRLILEYSRLGDARPGTFEVALLPLVEALAGEMAAELSSHQIRLEAAIAPTLALVGTPEHFEAMLRNLLHNAREAIVERQDEGPRLIRVEAAPEASRLALRVIDTGVGIAPEHRGRIFAPFFSTRPATGTGLGLGIVEKMVSIYQGTIALETEEGKGTTFTVSLPQAVAAVSAR
jgi:histidine kinase